MSAPVPVAPLEAPAAPAQEGGAARPRTNAELRDEATRRMISTATRLIAERGASKLSLFDVGKDSGYSHSLPNYYFKSKTGLLHCVYTSIIEGARDGFRRWARRNIPERIRPGMSNIRATVRGYLGMVNDDHTASRAMHVLWSESISSMPELLEVVRPMNRRFIDFFEQEFRVAIERGEIDPGTDVEAVAMLLTVTIRGTVAQYMVDPERVDLPRLSEALLKLLDRAVGARTPIA